MDHEMQMRNHISQMEEWQIESYIEGFDILTLAEQYGYAFDIEDMARAIDLMECVNQDQAMILAILAWDHREMQNNG